MSTKIKTIIPLCLALLASVFIFSACNSEPHVHQYGEWAETKAATCTAAGEEARQCSCGDTQTRELPIKDHFYGEWVVVKAATCTEDGIQEQSCVCGDKKTQTIPATGHKYGEWAESKSATCTEDGVKEQSCVCGDKKTQTIPATGHKYGEWAESKSATCTKDGVKEQSCACGDKKTKTIPATGHKYGKWTVGKEATCAKAGEKYAVCSTCNDKKTESIPKSNTHVYDGGTITKKATCTAVGNKKYTCNLCGSTKVENISALGHEVNNEGKCSRCGVVTLNMTSEEIEKSKKIKTMSGSVYEESDEIDIFIELKDASSYSVKVPAYVDVRIVDSNGKTLYSKTLIKKASSRQITIDYDDVTKSYTNTGTLYYKVYNDYFTLDEASKELEEIPWTVDVELPTVPQTIYYWSWSGAISSSCEVTGITYEINGSDIKFYFTGKKTYDRQGNSYSDYCKIGWKLYDSEDYVVANGTCYTTALKVDEKFKDALDKARGVIEQGKTYRLEILNVS